MREHLTCASLRRILTLLCLSAAGLAPRALAGGGTPPTVHITFPNGGEMLPSSSTQSITFTATDSSGFIAGVDVYLSFDGGAHWDPLAFALSYTGSASWIVQNRPGSANRVRVIAYDGFGNAGTAES